MAALGTVLMGVVEELLSPAASVGSCGVWWDGTVILGGPGAFI